MTTDDDELLPFESTPRPVVISDFWRKLASGEITLDKETWWHKRYRWRTSPAYKDHRFPWEELEEMGE